MAQGIICYSNEYCFRHISFWSLFLEKELVLKNINFEFDKATGRISVRSATIPYILLLVSYFIFHRLEWKNYTKIEPGDILVAVNSMCSFMLKDSAYYDLFFNLGHYFVSTPMVNQYIEELSKFICECTTVLLLFLNKRVLEYELQLFVIVHQ